MVFYPFFLTLFGVKGMGLFGKSKSIEEMNPKEVEKQAVKHFKKKEYAEAEPYIRKLIEFKPNYAAAYSYLSTCLLCLERKEEALEQIDAALKIEPDKPSFLFTRGVMLAMHEDRIQEAITSMERSVSLGYQDRQSIMVLQAIKKKHWVKLPPTTGDHIFTINRTIDPEALKPVEDPELDKVLEAEGISKEGRVAVNITPTLNFIAEIANDAIKLGKQVSMRDLCQKGGVISDKKGIDVVDMACKMHGLKSEYTHLQNDDVLVAFTSSE